MSEAHLHPQSLFLFLFFPLAATSALVLTALVYIHGWLRIRSVSRNMIPDRRLAAFVGGLALVWIVVWPPLATLDHSSLTLHMVKHLLLMTVAAPLILAGAPDVVLIGGLPTPFIRSEKMVGNRVLLSLGRIGTHPLSCWLAGTTAVIGWHLPVAFQLGMRSQWAHNVEDVCFLLAGLMFWWPVAQSSLRTTKSPRWSMALYLFLATVPCDILSAFLVFCNRLVYPCYLSSTHLFGFSPLQDQECAGALMWVWVTFAYSIPAVVITMKILSPSNPHVLMPPQATWPTFAARLRNTGEAEVV